MILVGESSLRRAVDQFCEYYHEERNHQGLENRIIEPEFTPSRVGEVNCRERLGGLLRYYYRADRAGVALEISPRLIGIFRDGIERYGEREWSPNIIRRLEDACDTEVLAPGFPAQMLDDEPEETGNEIDPFDRCSGSG